MKKVIVLMFALAITSTPVLAEDAGDERGPGPRGGAKQLTRMQEHLGLSNEQVEQIRQIRESGGGREEIQAVLTKEQLAKMQERRRHMQGRGGQRGGHGKQGKGDARGQAGQGGNKPDGG